MNIKKINEALEGIKQSLYEEVSDKLVMDAIDISKRILELKKLAFKEKQDMKLAKQLEAVAMYFSQGIARDEESLREKALKMALK